MMLQCRTVQFIPNPARMEGRNIAVFASSAPDEVFVRALGDSKHGFDALSVRALPGISDANDWVFREWHGWFHDLARGCGWEKISLELDRINLRGLNFVAMPEQSFDIPASQPAQAVDKVAELLIGKLRRPRANTFEEQVQAVLSLSEIQYRDDFIEEARVEIETGKDGFLLSLDFPYLVNAKGGNGVKTGILIVKPNKTGIVPARSVSHAIYTFDKAVQAGLLQRGHCVALVGPMQSGQALVSDLARSSVLLNIFDPDTPSALLELVEA